MGSGEEEQELGLSLHQVTFSPAPSTRPHSPCSALEGSGLCCPCLEVGRSPLSCMVEVGVLSSDSPEHSRALQ